MLDIVLILHMLVAAVVVPVVLVKLLLVVEVVMVDLVFKLQSLDQDLVLLVLVH